ncbi:MAG: FCD domain-containing protein [Spirochaetaceae bacterium]|nr:MAG: FCD domain-containing protein [Spirochaetaceae bacterium]
MDTTFTDREITILEVIGEYGQPLGAWNLAELLINKGINVGTSTVGRTLNRLEKKGFLTKKQSNRGRTITEKGRAFLSDYRQEMQLKPLNKRLRDMLNTRVLEKYLMVLEARKVLERAIVRLAATQITAEEIAQLTRNVHERENRHRQSKSHADLDIAFHTTIAKACRNQVLSLLYQTIATLGQQSELFQALRQRVGAPYLTSHREILEALKINDPDRAEECIVEHIDMLIGDVKRYWDTYFS